jgi:pimeloyl-ACP methyl ester carboxylesterase
MRAQVATGGWVEFGDTGRGRPVVLLHAFPLGRAMWRSQVAALQADYRVITPDLRGFGGTDAFAGPPSVDAMADDLAALLDVLEVREPVALGGLSMGGYVALAFARRHAGRLAALVLADTRAEPDNDEGRANRDKLIAFAEQQSTSAVIEQMMPRLVSDETRSLRPEVVEEVRRLGSAQSPRGVIGALQAMRDRPDARPGLGRIKVPTLVVVGSEDAFAPPAVAESLTGAIAGAQRVVIPGAGHLSNLERPEPFNEALRAFLREVY